MPPVFSTGISEPAVAPGAQTYTVGIRPGEKLHEEMISPDDASRTTFLGDRYLVAPAIADWGFEAPSEGVGVPEGFAYRSDSNDVWLDADQLREMVSSPDGH